MDANRNMAGLTAAEIEAGLDKVERGCLAAGVCLAALGIIGAGWLVCLACGHWPRLCQALNAAGPYALGVASGGVLMCVAVTATAARLERRGGSHD